LHVVPWYSDHCHMGLPIVGFSESTFYPDQNVALLVY